MLERLGEGTNKFGLYAKTTENVIFDGRVRSPVPLNL
jgi:hypothetical protein